MNMHISQDRYPFYSKDKKGLYLLVNQEFLDVSMIDSSSSVIGLTDECMPWSYNAQSLMYNDKRVIELEKTQIYIEKSIYDGKPHFFRSVKTPLFGRTGKVLGVQCVSIPVSERCAVPLSDQQTACLKLLAMGCTYKLIAKELGLSAKTVEHYLDAVKLKLNCESRSDLIMQAVERGLVGVF